MFSSWNSKNPAFESLPTVPQSMQSNTPSFFSDQSQSQSSPIALTCNANVNETAMNTDPSPSPPISSAPTYVHSDFVSVSLNEKLQIFQHMSSSFLSSRLSDLQKLIPLHMNILGSHTSGRRKNLAELRSHLLIHQCHTLCLIRHSHAQSSGFYDLPSLSLTDFSISSKALRLRIHNSSTSQKRKCDDEATTTSNKKIQLATSSLPRLNRNCIEPPEPEPDANAWVEILTWDEKRVILQEAFDANNNESTLTFLKLPYVSCEKNQINQTFRYFVLKQFNTTVTVSTLLQSHTGT
ncbi:hypothetical protein GGU11DRAFT_799541 [Lentinula aff. detonsa]|nr:hypothetical protein GGU11DRAFT_799541 [Lentinula aff. detonsa]